MHKIILTSSCLLLSVISFAQKADGTTRSLVAAERAFAESLSKDGAKKAFTSYAADDALVFRPNPVNAKTFYAAQGDNKNLSWMPVYAKVSRSGDLGFTTGPYILNAAEKQYGQYLSIWSAKNGRWELIFDLGIGHNKPLKPVIENFLEPAPGYKPRLFTQKEMQTGIDIISSTEKTLNSTLSSYGPVAMAGFLNPDARLLIPGYEPIIGKENILAYNNRMVKSLSLTTTGANKSVSGEIAYTYGVATLDYKADLRESFNYVFIWERQADHNWNITLQMFVPAER